MLNQEEQNDILLFSLRDTLPSLKTLTDDQIIKRVGKEKFSDIALDITGFIEAGAGSELSKNERIALTCQALRCLSRYLKERDLPNTLKTIIDSTGLLEFAVDRAFPGYHAAHLLKLTILPARQ